MKIFNEVEWILKNILNHEKTSKSVILTRYVITNTYLDLLFIIIILN